MNARNGVTVTLLFAALAFLANGCASIKSTLYSHDGCQDCAMVKKRLKGVPTTLEVPTHLHVTVVKTRFGKVGANGLTTFVPNLETREVTAEPVTQKQIFTVDFKRPAAGELKYKVTLDPKNQYITKVENELTDETIMRVTALITTILGTIPRGAMQAEMSADELVPFREVIATEVFELSEVNLDTRIQAFLDVYVNQCHPRCPPCVHPGPAPGCVGCGAPHGAGCFAGCKKGHH